MIVDTSESQQWTSDPLNEKFHVIPDIYYRNWLKKANFNPEGKHILDFGCGSGLISSGIACYLNPSYVEGVDLENYIDLVENSTTIEKYGFIQSTIQERILFRKIGCLESLGNNKFDCILSWSVIEHISRPNVLQQFKILYDCLKPNGVAIIQSAPLYFSPYGSHIYKLDPWAHLYLSDTEYFDKVVEVEKEDRIKALMSCKSTLNRFDSHDFTECFLQAGFKIIDIYRTYTELTPQISLIQKYSFNALKEEQALWVIGK